MKKLIILIEIIIIISLLYLSLPKAGAEEFTALGEVLIPYTEYYVMSGTAYTSHPDCMNPHWLDGLTATNTIARVGIVAINIDLDSNGTPRVNSVLKIGQIIYVKGQFIEGIFTVEDTGYFKVKYLKDANPKDLKFDIYNLDFYVDDILQARGFGIQYPIGVWVIGEL